MALSEHDSAIPDRRLLHRGRRLLRAFAVVLVCAVVAIGKLQLNSNATQASLHRQQSTLHDLVVEGCQRQNVKQAEDNRSQLADYRFFTLVLGEIRANLRHAPKAQRGGSEAFLRYGERAADAKSWVAPIADCSRATVGYKPPGAIPFHDQLPPPSALR